MKKYYIIDDAKRFYKDRLVDIKKPLIVLRYNIEKDTLNPAKRVKSITEGMDYIKSIDGIFVKDPYKLHELRIFYGDLFTYLDNIIKFSKMRVENCSCKLLETEKFCKEKNLDYIKIKKKLESTGGHCDCEVLLNSTEMINPNELMPIKKLNDF